MKKNISNQEYSSVGVQIFIGNIENKDITIKIIEVIKSRIPDAQIIGATTDGEIVNGAIVEGTITISFFVFKKSFAKSFYYENNDLEMLNTCEIIVDAPSSCIAANIKKNLPDETKVIILLSDGLKTNAESLIDKIHKMIDIPVIGGTAGDNERFSKTFVIEGNSSVFCESGVVGFYLYGADLRTHCYYNDGWMGIGREFTITKSNKNVVQEINGMNALDFFKYYLSVDSTSIIKEMIVRFPLMVIRNGLEVYRAILGIDSNGYCIFASNIIEGEKFKISVGISNDLIENSRVNANTLINFDPESVFTYSCMARKKMLLSESVLEIDMLKTIKSTVVGFFTYGEFYKRGDYSAYHNETCSVLGLSENKKNKDRIEIKKRSPKFKKFLTEQLPSPASLVSNFLNRTNEDYLLISQEIYRRYVWCSLL
nr:FIST N-terminal domain-containing protein [Sulfurimonas sp. SAG-AH-194-I05]